MLSHAKQSHAEKLIRNTGRGHAGHRGHPDLARFADPAAILLGDYSEEQARRRGAGERARGARDLPAVRGRRSTRSRWSNFLREADVVLSCVPYWMHRGSPRSRSSSRPMVDLGGNTDIHHADPGAGRRGQEGRRDGGAGRGARTGAGEQRRAGPHRAVGRDGVVRLYCGVLPKPSASLNYKLTFNVEGLVTEYDFQATVLRGGEVVAVDTLDELEEVHLGELGPMEPSRPPAARAPRPTPSKRAGSGTTNTRPSASRPASGCGSSGLRVLEPGRGRDRLQARPAAGRVLKSSATPSRASRTRTSAPFAASRGHTEQGADSPPARPLRPPVRGDRLYQHGAPHRLLHPHPRHQRSPEAACGRRRPIPRKR